MEFFALFWASALTALAVENAVFARALGLNKNGLFLKSPQMGILYGGLLTFVACISSVFVAGVIAVLADHPYTRYVRAPLFLLCIGAVYMATHWASGRYLPRHSEAIRAALPISTFNTALFGAMYVSAAQGFGLVQTMGYALGSGLGYTLALLIIYYARKRLSISPVPRSFRGLPILLLYIGLLSLAIYGLIGHGLPT